MVNKKRERETESIIAAHRFNLCGRVKVYGSCILQITKQQPAATQFTVCARLLASQKNSKLLKRIALLYICLCIGLVGGLVYYLWCARLAFIGPSLIWIAYPFS